MAKAIRGCRPNRRCRPIPPIPTASSRRAGSSRPKARCSPSPRTRRRRWLELDGVRINAALAACPVVKLVKDGDKNAFLSSNIKVDGGIDAPGTGKTLWIDEGVTLFQSRNPALFQQTGNCGAHRRQRLERLPRVHHRAGDAPRHRRRGTIDGQGGEPMVGKDYSWWQASYALRAIDGSIGQPNMINLREGDDGLRALRPDAAQRRQVPRQADVVAARRRAARASATPSPTARATSSGASRCSRPRSGSTARAISSRPAGRATATASTRERPTSRTAASSRAARSARATTRSRSRAVTGSRT